MQITILPNGNLKMSASVADQRDIHKLRSKSSSEIFAESMFISDFLEGDPCGTGVSYTQVSPEEVGALTSAPLITDGKAVWGYMDYQVKSFLEELAAGHEIIWQKG